MKQPERSIALDAARGVAILIVILGHALQGACGGGCDTRLHQFILTFQMEFFFVLCGISATYSHATTFADAMRKKFLRLVVPYLAWVWIFYIAEAILGVKSWTMSDALSCLVFSGFWFLRQLFLIGTAFETFRFGARRWNPLVGALLGLALFGLMLLIPGQGGLDRYAIFFVGGYLLGLIAQHAYGKIGQRLTLFSSLKLKPLAWCGINSLALYAVHWNVFFVFLSLQLVNFKALSSLIGTGLTAAILFALYLFGSVLLILLMRKIPYLAQVFLGDRWLRRRSKIG